MTWECPAESAAATKRRSDEQALASTSVDGTPQLLKRRRCPSEDCSDFILRTLVRVVAQTLMWDSLPSLTTISGCSSKQSI